MFNQLSLEDIQSLFPNYSNFSILSQRDDCVIYKAIETSLNREIALKVINNNDEDQCANFLQEAQNLAKINNTAIVSIYDYGQIENILFISMEYIHGKPLHNSIYGVAIDTITASQIVKDLCQGLEATHTAGIIHGNLTADNIILDADARPKIINFGYTKSLNQTSTPGYCAPETLDNLADQRSDIFSLGIILKQMLTGTVAPHFCTDAEGVELIVEVPQEFQNIINTATADSPSKRYSSVATMGLILKDAMEDVIDESEADLKTATTINPATTNHSTQPKVRTATSTSNNRLLTSGNMNFNSNYTQPTLSSSSKSSAGLYVALILIAIGGATFFILNKDEKSNEVVSKPVPLSEVIESLDEPVEDTPIEEAPSSETVTKTTAFLENKPIKKATPIESTSVVETDTTPAETAPETDKAPKTVTKTTLFGSFTVEGDRASEESLIDNTTSAGSTALTREEKREQRRNQRRGN